MNYPFRQVLSDDTIIYTNDKGQYHRLDGPALEYSEASRQYPGLKLWIINAEVIGVSCEIVAQSFNYRFIKSNEEFLHLMKLKIFF